MSINLKNIQIKVKDMGDVTVFHASLSVNNTNSIPKRAMNLVPKKDRADYVFNIEHTLAMSIIAHIYGDLIEPINELATLAEFHVTSNKDIAEIKEIRQRLADILLGKIPEVKDEGVIIKGN